MQQNSWDCGVYTCLYAHSLYCIKDNDFTHGESAENFVNIITNYDQFKFTPSCVLRWRRHTKTLLLNLKRLHDESIENSNDTNANTNAVARRSSNIG